MQDPGPLIDELRRVVGGWLRAITIFYPPEDDANRQVIEANDVAGLIYKGSLLRNLAAAGWRAQLENICQGIARPTPPAELFEGAQIDSLPAAETRLQWANLAAH